MTPMPAAETAPAGSALTPREIVGDGLMGQPAEKGNRTQAMNDQKKRRQRLLPQSRRLFLPVWTMTL